MLRELRTHKDAGSGAIADCVHTRVGFELMVDAAEFRIQPENDVKRNGQF